MDEQKSNSIRVTNKQRIIRIFGKICQSKLAVFIRAEQSSNIVVKGRASDLDFIPGHPEEEQQLVFMVGGLSEKGMHYLSDKGQVQIEFVMTASRVVGQCQVVRRGPSYITLSLPTSLVTVERRHGARYKTRPDLAAYAVFSLWEADRRDYVSAPFFPHQHSLGQLVPLADISTGGFALASRFPSINQHVGAETIDPEMRLYLPMCAPLQVSVTVRWIKKRIEHLPAELGQNTTLTTFLLGCMFCKANDEKTQQEISRFMQRLVEADAI